MRLIASTAVSVLLTCVGIQAHADTITDWNETAIETMKAARSAGNPWSRSLAMMHVAMSDAVNATQNKYARVVDKGPMANGASADAAAASAARQILLHLYPAQKAMIETAYTASLNAIPDNAARKTGEALGERVAAAVQDDRAGDGTSVPETYRPITTPGVWVPTTLPIFSQYAQAKPWVMKTADQFRPGPPPPLTSDLYARDYNETKSLGGTKSAQRTAEQTAAVKFWTQANLGPAWQTAARQMAVAKGLDLADSARLFALLNMGVANTFINDWDAKFTYNFWRPMTAIRNGDMDGNDATQLEAGWTPLNDTPMHPEYPSQAAIIAGVAVSVFDSVFGPNVNIPITVSDLMDAKLQRQYASTKQISDEHQDVRVWGGIHFRNSLNVGYDMGTKVAAYVIEHSLTPVK